MLDLVRAPILFIEDTLLILSSHLRLVIPSGLVSRGFLSKILFAPFLSPILDTCPYHLIFLDSNRRVYRNINPIESNEIESNVIECGTTQWRTEGEVGVFKPPPEILKVLQNRAKLNPIVKI